MFLNIGEKSKEQFEEELAYANGTCDLAINNRDIAEKKVEELEYKILRARYLMFEILEWDIPMKLVLNINNWLETTKQSY